MCKVAVGRVQNVMGDQQYEQMVTGILRHESILDGIAEVWAQWGFRESMLFSPLRSSSKKSRANSCAASDALASAQSELVGVDPRTRMATLERMHSEARAAAGGALASARGESHAETAVVPIFQAPPIGQDSSHRQVVVTPSLVQALPQEGSSQIVAPPLPTSQRQEVALVSAQSSLVSGALVFTRVEGQANAVASAQSSSEFRVHVLDILASAQSIVVDSA